MQEDSFDRNSNIVRSRGGNFSITGTPYAAIGRNNLGVKTDLKSMITAERTPHDPTSIFSSGVSQLKQNLPNDHLVLAKVAVLVSNKNTLSMGSLKQE